ncbi:MAG: hypothetical protein VYD15_06200, partial [Actinomycetota bacterium]|nr:hypothetical protein [Actinomycetota bacterium]
MITIFSGCCSSSFRGFAQALVPRRTARLLGGPTSGLGILSRLLPTTLLPIGLFLGILAGIGPFGDYYRRLVSPRAVQSPGDVGLLAYPVKVRHYEVQDQRRIEAERDDRQEERH